VSLHLVNALTSTYLQSLVLFAEPPKQPDNLAPWSFYELHCAAIKAINTLEIRAAALSAAPTIAPEATEAPMPAAVGGPHKYYAQARMIVHSEYLTVRRFFILAPLHICHFRRLLARFEREWTRNLLRQAYIRR
jgi:hypothetical protein